MKMNRYSVEKLQDQRNHYYYHYLSVKEKAPKIECTCAVDTYVTKSKLPIELNILHTNGSETT